MDKNNLSVQASLDTSQLKKDLEKFKGEITLNANTKSLKKHVEAALKETTVQPSIDTSQLEKELEKFKGEVHLKADTKTLTKQLQTAIANASQNATANIHCSLSGMDSVIGQMNTLKQAASSLNNDIRLNVSMDTSGLQQYTAQLEKLNQLSPRVQAPTVETASTRTNVSLPTANISAASTTSAPETSFKTANTESKGFLDTLNQITAIANTPLMWFSERGIIKGYDGMFKGLSKNLD